jgi:DNA repair photolyase
MTIKNRGALSNPEGRFEKHGYEAYDDGWNLEEEALPALTTLLFPEKAKSVITHNDSPDIGFEHSINPYRGCEHGCIYCYARPSHAYMNLSPGLDFETKIFYKENAAQLLEMELAKPGYVCKPIMLGANTDPYQPAENRLRVTRSILEVLNRCHHPVVIITKNSLIERDIDLIAEMAKRRLATIAVSITTLRTELKHILEPRTSAPQARLRVIRTFSEMNIPVRVMTAPMIPMINDMELERILGLASGAGATHASFTLIRLPHEVKTLFKEWLATHFPERAEHVMSLIRQMRGGKEYDSTFGKRMRGEGEFAALLAQRFKIACRRYRLNTTPSSPLDTGSFLPPVRTAVSPQLDLWG